MMSALVLSVAMLCGCGAGADVAATPTISTTAALNGAVVARIATTTAHAKLYYTLDGTVPTASSQIYEGPFLVAAKMTVKAMAAAPGFSDSAVASQTFAPNIAPGTLVWSDEFTGTAGTAHGQPNPATWTYDVGLGRICCGNNEPETYCAWGSTAVPCDPSNPNAYVGEDGYLHVVARQPKAGVATYTSARLKSAGLFSFMYGRIEARMKLPESQGMWPAFWLLGNNIATVSWPACGELDVMEHIDGSHPPPSVGAAAPGYDWFSGSVHGGVSGAKELNGTQQYHPAGFSAADWHVYGMIWSKGKVQYYVDDPTNMYATFTAGSGEFSPGTWPFDAGPQFVILNLAVGGDWPGNPDSTTIFPGTMLVDYVRIYAN